MDRPEKNPNPQAQTNSGLPKTPGFESTIANTPTILNPQEYTAKVVTLQSGHEILNRFTLSKKLGQGGMGVVWLARDATLDQEVALKFLPEAIRADSEAVESLKRETRRALKLTHPNIVRVHDFIESEDLTAISMEYIPGSSLQDLKKTKAQRHFEPSEILEWIHQICEALEYAHTGPKIIHRDIKPANILLDDKGQVRITDFGIARSLADSRSRMSVGSSGTPCYMSPQQARGKSSSPQDDIYALGATIYDLLTSRPPFYTGEVIFQVMSEVPPSMTERRKELEVDGEPIPAQWEAVVAACLSKESEKRPPSAKAIYEQLTHSKSGSLVVVPAVPSAPGQPDVSKDHPATPAKSKTSLFPALAACLLLLGVAGAWYFLKYQPVQERQRQAAVQQARDTAEKKRLADEAEAKRLAEEKLAQEVETKRLAEEKLKQEAEAKRVAEENQKQEAETKRLAEQKLKQETAARLLAEAKAQQEESKRKAAERVALEEKARLEAELKRIADEKALTEKKAKEELENFKNEQRLKTLAEDGDIYAAWIFICKSAEQGKWREYIKWQNIWLKSRTQQDVDWSSRYMQEFQKQKTLAEKGSAFDMNVLGNLYRNGIGTATNFVEALKWYRRAAEKDYAVAQDNIGDMYRDALGVSKDYAEALKWYRKSANLDYAMAQADIGIMYEKGLGVAKDELEAVRCYRKAAALDFAPAQSRLGGAYLHGMGVAKDEVEGVKWLRKAAEQEYTSAQNNLANCYSQGLGVARDESEAVKWYRKAADKGVPMALLNLGCMYAAGRGVAKDEMEAIKLYRKALALRPDFDYAQTELGSAYLDGRGVPKDEQEAVRWFRKAVEKDHPRAQALLGVCYANGLGVAKDDNEAVKWFRKAIENQDVTAQNWLGYMYENGRGVSMDITEAIKWYRKAADQGSESAKKRLSELGK